MSVQPTFKLPGSAFAKVTVKAYVDRVAIVHKGEVVAEHRRRYDRHESSIKPEHFVVALLRKPAWLDHVPAMRDWELPASFEQLRTRLRELHGTRTGDRQYIRVLQLLLHHPSERIDTAIQRSVRRSTLTAELIAEITQKLADDVQTIHQTDHGEQAGLPSELTRHVQVPMPDLRRFDHLLSSPVNKEGGLALQEGESFNECFDTRTPIDAAAASSQDPSAADHAQRVCQAGS